MSRSALDAYDTRMLLRISLYFMHEQTGSAHSKVGKHGKAKAKLSSTSREKQNR